MSYWFLTRSSSTAFPKDFSGSILRNAQLLQTFLIFRAAGDTYKASGVCDRAGFSFCETRADFLGLYAIFSEAEWALTVPC